MVEIDAVRDPQTWPTLPGLAERYTDQILEILAEHDVRATFFMLGWLCEQHPHLAPKIASAGHEMALHSYWHRRVDQLSPEEFRQDLQRNKDLLEQQTGQAVRGFRAPSFSVTPGAEWAFDVMHDIGLSYDASLFPAKRGHGGYPCQRGPHRFQSPSGRVMPELPMSVMRLGPKALPFSGGGYLRLLTQGLIRRGFEQLHRQGLPVVVYLHPRDFAVDCPRVAMPPHRRFKCYVGMKSTAGKMRMMLERYRFDTCWHVLQGYLSKEAATS